MLGHFESLTVENGLVRIAVMPQLGGRVVEYTSKASGHNQLDARLEALGPYRPGDDVPRGVLYKVSGHEDMITVEGKWHWPGDFQQEPYALEILRQSPEEVIFRLTAAKGIVRIERTHTLKRGATTLFTDLEVTNTSDVDVEMMLRHKVATRVGGTARLGDTITYPSQQGVVRKTFFPSGHWMDFLLAAGWIGASDPLTRETMLLTGDFEQLGNGGVWFDKQGYYNLEFFGRKQMVPAGSTVSLASQWHLFTDMPAITFAADGLVGCFEGEKGEGNRFTLKTGLVALAPIGRVSIEGFFYNGPNRIDGFHQQMATHPLGLATAMVSKELFSPVNEVRGRITVAGQPALDLAVPLLDSHPPPPVRLVPLAKNRFRYTLQETANHQLWVESTAGHVVPDEVFVDDGPSRNRIEIDLLPNEYECVQLVIRAKQRDIRGVEAIFEDLKESNSGGLLPASSWKFYRGETIRQESGVPLYDPLIPEASVTARKGKNALLFIELHCDAMQLAGTYVGRIKLRDKRKTFSPIEVQVTVRPFQMPQARSIDTAFWVWKTWNVKGANTTATWPQLARYRLSPGWLKNQFHASSDTQFLDDAGQATEGKVDVGTAEAKARYAEGLHDHGINRFSPGYNIWGYADTRDWKHRLVRNTRAQAGWLEGIGVLDECYYQIVDEPLASRFGQLKQVIKLYRQANPDYRIMCTVAINPDLYGYIDMWHVPWGGLDPPQARQRQALGESVWMYNAPPDITGIGKLPRLIGWFCWKYKVDGYMHFAIDYPDSPTVHNPWQSTGSHWTILFYPVERTYDSNKHVWENFGQWDWSIPSIRLMQIRDGFEDYELMRMLDKWIRLARRHNRHEQDTALLAEAEKLLDIEKAFVGNFITFTDRPEDMMEARHRVMNMVDRVRQAVTGEPF